MLLFMPLAFGAVEAWSGFIVLVGSLGLLACLGVHAWRQRATGGLVWSAAYVPLALFIFLALLQAMPVPFGLIQLISPQAANLYHDLRDEVLGAFTLSLYPRATWLDLCLVVTAAIVFLSTVNFVRRGTHIKRMLLSIAVIGSGFAVLALVQGLFGNGRIYFIGPAEVQANSGTFACHNHFSQHMVLSAMAMLAYSMIRTREVLGRSWLDRASLGDWMVTRELRGVRWLMLFAIVALVAVAMSVSRMGTVSAAAALVVIILMYALRRGARQANLPLLVGLCALTVVVLVGFEMVFERLATLQSFDAYENRWIVVKDLLPAFTDFPLIGSGLGTFAVVYPMYDTGYTWRFASHAENEYAQLLLEMGIVGFALVAWFLVVVGRSFTGIWRRMNRPLYVAGPPLAGGLIAVMLHSWTDFGQHLPAIAVISAIFCGLIVVLGQRASRVSAYSPNEPAADSAEQSARPASATRRQLLVNWLLGVMAIILLLNAPAGFFRVFAEEYDRAALAIADRLDKARWQGPDADYVNMVALGERAVELDPNNVVYRYRLGVYRWWDAVRDRDGEAPDEQHLRDTAARIVDEMISASAACPTMGSIHSWRGQLEWWVLGMADGRDRVEKAARTARNDRVTLHAAGLLAAVEQEPELALERFRRSLEVRGNFTAAATVLLDELNRPDLALELTAGDPHRLHEVAGLLKRKGYDEQSADAQRQALAAYEGRLEDRATPAWAIAALAADASAKGQHDQAIDLYTRALSKEYAQVNWRAASIRSMLAAERLTDAAREIDVLQRLNANARLIETLRDEYTTARRAAATRPAQETQPQ